MSYSVSDVNKEGQRSVSLSVTDRMFDDLRQVYVSPLEVVTRGASRSAHRKDLDRVTQKERDQRKILYEKEAELAQDALYSSSPPRESPGFFSAWGNGDKYSALLHTEAIAARRRLEASESHLQQIEDQRQCALREHELSVERDKLAIAAQKAFDAQKTGWFFWR